MSDNSFDSDDSSFSDAGDTRTGRRRKNSKSRTHPKFRHKGPESERPNSRTKPTANGSVKKEAKIRLNCCKLCDYTSPKPSSVQKHLQKVRKQFFITIDGFYHFLTDHYNFFSGPSHRLCHIRYDKDKNHS